MASAGPSSSSEPVLFHVSLQIWRHRTAWFDYQKRRYFILTPTRLLFYKKPNDAAAVVAQRTVESPRWTSQQVLVVKPSKSCTGGAKSKGGAQMLFAMKNVLAVHDSWTKPLSIHVGVIDLRTNEYMSIALVADSENDRAMFTSAVLSACMSLPNMLVTASMRGITNAGQFQHPADVTVGEITRVNNAMQSRKPPWVPQGDGIRFVCRVLVFSSKARKDLQKKKTSFKSDPCYPAVLAVGRCAIFIVDSETTDEDRKPIKIPDNCLPEDSKSGIYPLANLRRITHRVVGAREPCVLQFLDHRPNAKAEDFLELPIASFMGATLIQEVRGALEDAFIGCPMEHVYIDIPPELHLPLLEPSYTTPLDAFLRTLDAQAWAVQVRREALLKQQSQTVVDPVAFMQISLFGGERDKFQLTFAMQDRGNGFFRCHILAVLTALGSGVPFSSLVFTDITVLSQMTGFPALLRGLLLHQDSPLEALDLSGCQLSSTAVISAIGNALSSGGSPWLRRLALGRNKFEDLTPLAESLNKLPSPLCLWELDVGGRPAPGAAEIMSALVARSANGLTHLNFSFCDLQRLQADILPTLLGTNPYMTILVLRNSNCHLEMPAQMLSSRCIRVLDLGYTIFGKHFADTLIQHASSGGFEQLEWLGLEGCRLTAGQLSAILAAFGTTGSKFTAFLGCNNIDAGIDNLGTLLWNNQCPRLERMSLRGTQMKASATLSQLLLALTENRTLTGLDLGTVTFAEASIPQAAAGLSSALRDLLVRNQTLIELDLSGSPKPWVTDGLRGLEENRKLQVLNLNGCVLGDRGGVVLGAALRKNRALTSLNIDGNQLTLNGFQAIRGALFGNKKLRDFAYPAGDSQNYLNHLGTGVQSLRHQETQIRWDLKSACRMRNWSRKAMALNALRQNIRARKAQERMVTKFTATLEAIKKDTARNGGIFQQKTRIADERRYNKNMPKEVAKAEKNAMQQMKIESKVARLVQQSDSLRKKFKKTIRGNGSQLRTALAPDDPVWRPFVGLINDKSRPMWICTNIDDLAMRLTSVPALMRLLDQLRQLRASFDQLHSQNPPMVRAAVAAVFSRRPKRQQGRGGAHGPPPQMGGVRGHPMGAMGGAAYGMRGRPQASSYYYSSYNDSSMLPLLLPGLLIGSHFGCMPGMPYYYGWHPTPDFICYPGGFHQWDSHNYYGGSHNSYQGGTSGGTSGGTDGAGGGTDGAGGGTDGTGGNLDDDDDDLDADLGDNDLDDAADVSGNMDMYGSAGPRDLPDGGNPDGSGNTACTVEPPGSLAWKKYYKPPVPNHGQISPSCLNDTWPPNLRAVHALLVEAIITEMTARANDFKVMEFKKIPRLLASSLSRRQAHEDITIVTQCSVDRLASLERMAMAWNGVISCAVYVEFGQSWDDMFTSLQALHQRVEEKGQCRLDVSVLFGVEEEDEPGTDSLYPINSLRNLALDAVETELVFLLDIDFVPSAHLFDYLVDLHRIWGVSGMEKRALVVPAFEVYETAPGQPDWPSTRTKVAEKFVSGHAEGFHLKGFPRGHRATDYARWFSMPDDLGTPYDIPFEEYYEPYVVCLREDLPRYDERFRGYGFNKLAHTFHLNHVGYRFTVIPDHFVACIEHPRSAAWHATFGENRDPIRKVRIQSLYLKMKRELEEQISVNNETEKDAEGEECQNGEVEASAQVNEESQLFVPQKELEVC